MLKTQLNPDSSFTIKSKNTKIILDPVSTRPGFDFGIITYLKPDSIIFKPDSLNYPVFVSQDLFLLLQKLVCSQIIRPINHQLKIIPYNYAQELNDISVTAYMNEDGLTGSLALLIKNEETSIGYCRRFDIGGLHKRRINKWKKKLKAGKISTLCLGKEMFDSQAANITSARGLYKHLEKELADSTSSKISFAANPWQIDILHQFNKIGTDMGYTVSWLPNFAELLSYFYPEESFDTSLPNPNKELVQTKDFKASTINVARHPLKGLDNLSLLDSSVASLTPSDQTNFFNYFGKDQVHLI